MAPDLLESLLDGVPLPLVLVGADERVQAMNAAASDLFGPGGVGHTYVTVLRTPAILDCVSATLRLGEARSAGYQTADVAREAHFEVTCRPVATPEGDGVLVAFTDTTDREAASEVRRDFVASVSHELRTPLTAILGYIETLRGPARSDAAARQRFLETIRQEAERMSRLVRDLLSLNHVESEERLRPSERVELVGLVETAVSTVKNVAKEAGLTCDIAGDTAPTTVRGNPDQLP